MAIIDGQRSASIQGARASFSCTYPGEPLLLGGRPVAASHLPCAAGERALASGELGLARDVAPDRDLLGALHNRGPRPGERGRQLEDPAGLVVTALEQLREPRHAPAEKMMPDAIDHAPA
jgi:hypothetical protein